MVSDSVYPEANGMIKLLIVEDDSELRELLTIILKNYDFQVETAFDGIDAISKLNTSEKPAAILLDLFMPKMDGNEFLNHLRSGKIPGCENIPVILMSAANKDSDIVKNSEKHCQGYFPKPSPIQDIVTEIHKLI